MDEATKYLLGQGVLGFVCLALGWALRRLWMENKSLTDRLEAKADKHSELNREMAKQVTEAFSSALKQAEKQREAEQAARRAVDDEDRRPRRRPTIAKRVDDE